MHHIFILDTDAKRREQVLATLNDKFADLIANFNISEAYGKIVSAKPYKVLSCFVYDWTYVPLKRGQFEDMMKPMSPKPVKKNKFGSKNSTIKFNKTFTSERSSGSTAQANGSGSTSSTAQDISSTSTSITTKVNASSTLTSSTAQEKRSTSTGQETSSGSKPSTAQETPSPDVAIDVDDDEEFTHPAHRLI